MYILDQGKIKQLLETGEAVALDSELEIEDCIVMIAGIDKRLSFLKRLKEDRVKRISAELHKYESKREFIRNVILATLKANSLKSLDFPGVGRVVSRNTKGKWIIEDEDALIPVLENQLDADEMAKLVKTTKTLVKKELDAVLDAMDKAGEELPNTVKKEEDKTSLSISIYENGQREDDAIGDETDDTELKFDQIKF